jgi:hypothetical protein
MTARTCETCRFYKRPDGYCRRYPPMSATFNGFARPIRVDRTGWCGEHTPTTQDTRAALGELIASTADQYGDIEP